MSENALRARAFAERARMEIERTSFREDGRRLRAGDGPCDPARRDVEERTACGIDGVASRLQIGDRGLLGSDDEPRPGAKPQRGERSIPDGRVRCHWERKAEASRTASSKAGSPALPCTFHAPTNVVSANVTPVAVAP
jgi:hypothetical protein